MRVRPWTHLVVGAVLIALLSACGGNVAGSSPVPTGGPASTLSADRTTAGSGIIFPPPPTPLPSPWPPCYCPPGHHPCPDIACNSPDGATRAPAFLFTPPPQHCPTCPPGGYGSVSARPAGAIICPDIACFQGNSTKQQSDVLDKRGPQDS